jgi:mycofactocin system transcriptional regulator
MGGVSVDTDLESGLRRGRPPRTSRRQIEMIALRLFSEQGFDQTSIEMIAAAAGVNRRTLFRYFDSKSAILWNDFDSEIAAIRLAFAEVTPDVATMVAIRQVVVAVNRYSADDIPELRARMNLIVSVPALQASAGPHYDAWERAVAEFAAARLGQPVDSLFPLAIGRATLATCRAAYDQWLASGDADLPDYLDRALAGLATGFAEITEPN